MTRMPSREYLEAERIRRAAMRALRSGMRSRLTPRSLAQLAGCEQALAKNALETLKARRQLALDGDGYSLTEQGREGTAV